MSSAEEWQSWDWIEIGKKLRKKSRFLTKNYTSANQGYKTCFFRDLRPLLHKNKSEIIKNQVLYPWFALVLVHAKDCCNEMNWG